MKKIITGIKNNKKLLLLVVVIILGILYFTGVIFPRNKSEGLKTEKATIRDIYSTVSASGTITADSDSKVYFGTYGKVSALNVQKGSKVKKGDILASLDSTGLYNSLLSSKETYKAALASKDSAVEARKEWMETNKDKEFTDIVRAQRAKLDAAVRSASASAEAAKANVSMAEFALSNTNLLAPFDGVVLEVNNIVAGENITATTNSYIRVATIDNLKFVAYVDEADLGAISLRQDVSVELDAFQDETFKGIVSYIYEFAEQTGSGSKIVPVEISLSDRNEKIKVGLSGDADFILDRKENVLTVPKNGLRNTKEYSYVMVLDKSGNIERRVVKVGLKNTRYVEVLEGLSEGDIVITSRVDDE